MRSLMGNRDKLVSGPRRLPGLLGDIAGGEHDPSHVEAVQQTYQDGAYEQGQHIPTPPQPTSPCIWSLKALSRLQQLTLPFDNLTVLLDRDPASRSRAIRWQTFCRLGVQQLHLQPTRYRTTQAPSPTGHPHHPYDMGVTSAGGIQGHPTHSPGNVAWARSGSAPLAQSS